VTLVLLLASAAMAAVAAAGIMWPFGRGRGPAMEPLADPLEDERDLLLTNLRDLESEHATGSLADDEYRALRHETERRAVAVLRAIDARAGGTHEGLAALRDAVSPNGHHFEGGGRRVSPRAAVLGGLAVAVVVALLLVAAIAPRDSSQTITGDTGIGGSSVTSLAYFKQRVQKHPQDVAARLDLAQRYRDAGMTGLASLQYTEAIHLDPTNAEALTGMAFVLFDSGRSREALGEVQRALAVDATYPEALYEKGLILLRGLDRPAEAAAPLTAYLSAAPDGAYRAAVQAMLTEITPESPPPPPSPSS
jgi:cytochrome c-type biogenesis protein CcmI